jgi:hypothetical protein
MRRLIFAAAVLCALAFAIPAEALEEGEFALAPQLGMVTLPGRLGGLFAADFGYGAGVAYGICNLVGLEADTIYSVHQELKRSRTGELTLVHFVAGLGPRFNWQNQYGVLYVGPELAMSFLKYRARWMVGDDARRDNHGAHGYGGMLSLGGDFFLADSFTMGLSFRFGGFDTNLVYSHLNEDRGKAGFYAFVAGLLRLTLLY